MPQFHQIPLDIPQFERLWSVDMTEVEYMDPSTGPTPDPEDIVIWREETLPDQYTGRCLVKRVVTTNRTGDNPRLIRHTLANDADFSTLS